jgi:hypothetical protein
MSRVRKFLLQGVRMYERRVVLFLDILGFKKLIEEQREDLILSALEIPTSLKERYPFDGKTEMQMSAFSDSIVVSEVVKDDHIGVIRMVNYASHLWWRFFEKGVLTRGGISVGNVHHKNGILFGPAMNEAYELESQLAIYPRIVLSKDVQKTLLDELVHTHKNNTLMLMMGLEIMRCDFDGVSHVHVLGPNGHCPIDLRPSKMPDPVTGVTSFTMNELNEAKWAAVEDFVKHRPTVLRAATKYDWLANYLAATRPRN